MKEFSNHQETLKQPTQIRLEEDIMEILGLTKKALQKLCRNQKIPHHKFNGKNVFLLDELEEYIRNLEPTPIKYSDEQMDDYKMSSEILAHYPSS